MAIIIDFTSGDPTIKKQLGRPTTKDSDAPLEKEDKPSWKQCQHPRSTVSEEQRTVTCKDCGAAVDPIAYILLLYGHYQRRIDSRLAEIREFEKRQKDSEVRKKTRERQPRRARIERRVETAERQAYNEYQAKVLSARAERQRQLVARLDSEIAALPPDEAQSAASVGAEEPSRKAASSSALSERSQGPTDHRE